jgi:hypothetical protein
MGQQAGWSGPFPDLNQAPNPQRIAGFASGPCENRRFGTGLASPDLKKPATEGIMADSSGGSGIGRGGRGKYGYGSKGRARAKAAAKGK